MKALEVRGRRSGRLRSFPGVVADYGGERYLVAMLGEGASWVANVREARGQAVLQPRPPRTRAPRGGGSRRPGTDLAAVPGARAGGSGAHPGRSRRRSRGVRTDRCALPGVPDRSRRAVGVGRSYQHSSLAETFLEPGSRSLCHCARQNAATDHTGRSVPIRPPTAGELGPCRERAHGPSISSDRCQPCPGRNPLWTACPAGPSFGRNDHHREHPRPELRAGGHGAGAGGGRRSRSRPSVRRKRGRDAYSQPTSRVGCGRFSSRSSAIVSAPCGGAPRRSRRSNGADRRRRAGTSR